MPNNIGHTARASLLRKLMAPTQQELMAKNPDKYPALIYGGPLPPIEVRRDWVKNTQWAKYGEDEDLLGCAKSAMQVEVGRAFEPVIEACLLYLKRTGKFRRSLRVFHG